MKKIFLIFMIGTLVFPINLRGQDEVAMAAVAGGLLALGSSLAALEELKEQLQQQAVEEILFTYKDIKTFQLKTSTLDGTPAKDVSSVRVVTYEILDYDKGVRYILFSFLSHGWANEYGVDFSKIKWKLFNQLDWNKLMKAYVETASRKETTIDEIAVSKIGNKGLKNGKDYILEFAKLRGDIYFTLDYSDEFKVVFNEGSLGLYLKEMRSDYKQEGSDLRGSLVQIRKKAIIQAHTHLNYQ
jgi:hypothetical protein|tara:strand:- start:964 stop:1689 length:726 start_codon:yes stop_codon:yes gene_type:complete